MAKNVILPDGRRRRLVFYLAMEEFVAKETGGEAFFLWQVEPTVIFGRNQLMEAEVNLEYCRSHGISVYRRKSGGGCVYADLGNVMLSYVGPREGAWEKYSKRLVTVLRGMGLDAEVSGRNDILVDGAKVSGTAFQLLPDRAVVHGTMLYDSNFTALEQALHPSAQKLGSKGIASVRSRVGNVKEAMAKRGLSIGLEEFKARILAAFCDGELKLNEEQVAEIEKIEAGYLSDDFLYGHNPRCTTKKRHRYEGVGEFEFGYTAKGSIFRELSLSGDYFLAGGHSPEELQAWLSGLLIGRPMTEEAVREALRDEDVGAYIANMDNGQLIDLITH